MSLLGSQERKNLEAHIRNVQNSVQLLKNQIAELSARPTKAEYATAQANINDLVKKLADSQKALEAEQKKVKVVDNTDELAKDTNSKVSLIVDFFTARWQTFRDFLNRRNNG